MSGNLYQASAQWAVRPDDERYSTPRELLEATKRYHSQTKAATVPYAALVVKAGGPTPNNPHGEVILSGPSSNPARLTHFAFGQLCARARISKTDLRTKEDVTLSSPASYLRMLPAPLAVDCLQYGLKERDDGEANLQFHENGGGLICKSLTSEKFSPFWNYQIAGRLVMLAEQGWKVPPARPAREGQAGTRIATEADVIASDAWGMSVSVGDTIAPAGLYASDHDMFAFLLNPEREVAKGLFRGFFCWNSEVGGKSFGIMTFLFNHVCGNHIVWDASDVKVTRIRHVGEDVASRANNMLATVREYSDASATQDKARIQQARAYKLGKDRESVLDAIFKMRINGLSKKRADEAYTVALEHASSEHYDPNTAWGYAQGITRLSQSVPYADVRTDLDTAAGKVVSIAF